MRRRSVWRAGNRRVRGRGGGRAGGLAGWRRSSPFTLSKRAASQARLTVREDSEMCTHLPRCPDGRAADRRAARVVACHPEQGWNLLCNGVVLFDDSDELLLKAPAARPVPAARQEPAPRRAAA
jgi:hypothetical protein